MIFLMIIGLFYSLSLQRMFFVSLLFKPLLPLSHGFLCHSFISVFFFLFLCCFGDWHFLFLSIILNLCKFGLIDVKMEDIVLV